VLILQALGLAALAVLADALVAQRRTVCVLDTGVALRVRVFAFAVVRELAVIWLAAKVFVVVAFVRFLVGLALASLADALLTDLTGRAVAAVVAFTFFALSILANTVVKPTAIAIGLAGGALRIRVFAPAVFARAHVRAVAVRFAVVAQEFVAILITDTCNAVTIFANFIVFTMRMFRAFTPFARSCPTDTVLEGDTVGMHRTGWAFRVDPRTRAFTARFAFQGLSSDFAPIVAFEGRLWHTTVAHGALEDFPCALALHVDTFVGKTSLGAIGAMNRGGTVGQWSAILDGTAVRILAVKNLVVRNVHFARCTLGFLQGLTVRTA
jgi:hypothetical protein